MKFALQSDNQAFYGHVTVSLHGMWKAKQNNKGFMAHFCWDVVCGEMGGR